MDEGNVRPQGAEVRHVRPPGFQLITQGQAVGASGSANSALALCPATLARLGTNVYDFTLQSYPETSCFQLIRIRIQKDDDVTDSGRQCNRLFFGGDKEGNFIS